MPLTVQRDGRSPAILPMADVLKLIPAGLPIERMLADIIAGGDVSVTLTDGTHAVISSTSAQRDPMAPPRPAQLRLPAPIAVLPTARRFELECEIYFKVSATIRCYASHRGAAERLVQQAFHGIAPGRDAGLEIDLTDSNLGETLNQIDHGLNHNEPTVLSAHHVNITSVRSIGNEP